MLDSMILLLALAASAPAIAPVEHGLIPLVATSSSGSRPTDRVVLDGAPGSRVSDQGGGAAASRWEGAGGQFLAGSAGGMVGTIGGGLVGALGGGVVGGILFGTESKDEDGLLDVSPRFGSILLGGLIGAAVGGPTGTAFMVERASPDGYPSRGMIPAFVGSALGAGGSIALMAYMGQTGKSDFQWGLVSGSLFVLGSSSLGAVLLDRAVASPASFSVAPWSPRPGMQGARVGFAF